MHGYKIKGMKNLKYMRGLDWKRHLHELRHQVLPIFLAVLAVGILVGALLAPVEKQKKEVDVNEVIQRVSLLSTEPETPFDPAFVLARPVELARTPLAPRVDWPMGSEGGALTYNAQPFLKDRHLGDDLNGIGGWDSDLGDAVYAVAGGEVTFAGWPSDGWGKVMMVAHQGADGRLVQSFYGHLEHIYFPVGARVRRGDKIGTVGKGDGQYLAHLHFEIREGSMLAAGPGYGDHAHGRLAGEKWIDASRGAPDDRLNAAVSGPAPNANEISIGVISTPSVPGKKK